MVDAAVTLPGNVDAWVVTVVAADAAGAPAAGAPAPGAPAARAPAAGGTAGAPAASVGEKVKSLIRPEEENM